MVLDHCHGFVGDLEPTCDVPLHAEFEVRPWPEPKGIVGDDSIADAIAAKGPRVIAKAVPA